MYTFRNCPCACIRLLCVALYSIYGRSFFGRLLLLRQRFWRKAQTARNAQLSHSVTHSLTRVICFLLKHRRTFPALFLPLSHCARERHAIMNSWRLRRVGENFVPTNEARVAATGAQLAYYESLLLLRVKKKYKPRENRLKH